jgi:hypothetical protein
MRRSFLPKRASGDAAAATDQVPASGEIRRLREERLRLAELVAERTWDLGGLTYEMAIRDHFRVDVLARKAAELQELESQLSEVERLMSHAEGVGGSCRYCGSPHARGAAYCWRCGHPLALPQRAGVPALAPSTHPVDVTYDEQPTAAHEFASHVNGQRPG